MIPTYTNSRYSDLRGAVGAGMHPNELWGVAQTDRRDRYAVFHKDEVNRAQNEANRRKQRPNAMRA